MKEITAMVRRLKKKFPTNYCSIDENHEAYVTSDRVTISYELYIADIFIKSKLTYKRLVKEVEKLLTGE